MMSSTAPNPVSVKTLPQILPSNKYKLVFLGDPNVGKTSIITRFMYGDFFSDYQATIGIDFLSKTMYVEDQTVRLQLWDTAGLERFRSLISSYIRGSNVAIVVYDVTSKSSFENTIEWLKEVQVERGSSVILMMVGNKSDLAEEREVSVEEGEELAKKENAIFLETSAKVGINIKNLFEKIAAELIRLDQKPTSLNPSVIDIKLSAQQPEKKATGCMC